MHRPPGQALLAQALTERLGVVLEDVVADGHVRLGGRVASALDLGRQILAEQRDGDARLCLVEQLLERLPVVAHGLQELDVVAVVG